MVDFDTLLDLEAQVQAAAAAEVFGADYGTRLRGIENGQKARRALYAAIDTLSTGQALAYGKYRRKVLTGR